MKATGKTFEYKGETYLEFVGDPNYYNNLCVRCSGSLARDGTGEICNAMPQSCCRADEGEELLPRCFINAKRVVCVGCGAEPQPEQPMNFVKEARGWVCKECSSGNG